MTVQLVDHLGNPIRSSKRKKRTTRTSTRSGPTAKYDAAQSTNENQYHWKNADALSANGANSAAVRDTLRRRARYEAANNGYAKGLIRGRANATIGVCPRLQLELPETFNDPDFGVQLATMPPDAARQVELKWQQWADRIGLADKLRLFDMAETRDGEAFAIEGSNPQLPEGMVKLDLRLYEADQIATPDLDTLAGEVDGIEFDQFGNPTHYHLLDNHPGDSPTWGGWTQRYQRVPADLVYHLFNPDRISEARTVPDVTPSLPLYNQMREFTMAALASAKLHATISGVLESELPPDGSDPPEIEEFDEIQFARNALLTTPAGWKAKAFDPAHPTQTYSDFKGEILTEAGRSINAPRNVSTGSSAEYNFSSGKLDRIDYEQDIRIRRDRLRRIILDRLFARWVSEAVTIPGYLPANLPPSDQWRTKWRWDGFASIDPLKDASAAQTRLESGVTTLERECAERGDDWEEVLEQQAREMAKRKMLGLPMPGEVLEPATVATDDEEVMGE